MVFNDTLPYSKVSGATTSTGYVMYNDASQGIFLFNIKIICSEAFTCDIISSKGALVEDFAVPAGGINLETQDAVKSIITTSGTTVPIQINGSTVLS